MWRRINPSLVLCWFGQRIRVLQYEVGQGAARCLWAQVGEITEAAAGGCGDKRSWARQGKII